MFYTHGDIMRQRERTNLGQYAFLIILSTIFAEQYFNVISVPIETYTVVSLFVFIFCNKMSTMQYFIMLIPFANAMHIKQIAVFYFITTIAKSKCYRFRRSAIFSYLIILALQLIATFRCNDSLSTLVYLAAVLGCVLLWAHDFYDYKACHRLLRSYVYSFAVMSTFMIALTLKLAPIDKVLNGVVRLGEDLYLGQSAFSTGANGLGMMCLFNAAVVFVLLSRQEIKKKNAIPLLVLFVVTGFMTQSRAFLLGCAFLTLYMVLCCTKNIIHRIKGILGIFTIVCVAIFIINKVAPNILQHFSQRFEVEDITNNRTDIMVEFFRNLFNDPVSLVLGAGLHRYSSVLGDNLEGMSSHNATQEVWLAWGIIGLISVVVFFISIIRASHLCGIVQVMNALCLELTLFTL